MSSVPIQNSSRIRGKSFLMTLPCTGLSEKERLGKYTVAGFWNKLWRLEHGWSLPSARRTRNSSKWRWTSPLLWKCYKVWFGYFSLLQPVIQLYTASIFTSKEVTDIFAYKCAFTLYVYYIRAKLAISKHLAVYTSTTSFWIYELNYRFNNLLSDMFPQDLISWKKGLENLAGEALVHVWFFLH